jgi:hypothetical protein
MGENEKRDALVGESEIVAFNLGESGLWGESGGFRFGENEIDE